MSDSAIPWTIAHQTPLSIESSRKEYWSGKPFSSPGDLPDPGIESGSPTLWADSLLSEPPGEPQPNVGHLQNVQLASYLVVKDGMLSPKTGSKTRMSILTTSIRYRTRGSS